MIHLGAVLFFTSGSESHFMNGDATITFLLEFLGGVIERQRQDKQMLDPLTNRAMLLADAFTGNFCSKGGENLRREDWAGRLNVELSMKVPGGWSANGAEVCV